MIKNLGTVKGTVDFNLNSFTVWVHIFFAEESRDLIEFLVHFKMFYCDSIKINLLKIINVNDIMVI